MFLFVIRHFTVTIRATVYPHIAITVFDLFFQLIYFSEVIASLKQLVKLQKNCCEKSPNPHISVIFRKNQHRFSVLFWWVDWSWANCVQSNVTKWLNYHIIHILLIKISETESCDVANTYWVLFSALWCSVVKIHERRAFCIRANRRREKSKVWTEYGISWNQIKLHQLKAFEINGISTI